MKGRLLLVACAVSHAFASDAFASGRDDDLKGLPSVVRNEILCERDGDLKVDGNRERLVERVPDRYVAWLRGGVNGAMASGADGSGLGLGVQLEGSLGLFDPLYVGAGLRWLSATQFHADAVVGLNFRVYGTRWIKAGASVSSGVVHAWGSNCQVRRTDYALVAGGKYIWRGADAGPYLSVIDAVESGQPVVGNAHVTALQLGIQQVERRSARSPMGGWSITALYDPVNGGYGAQGSYQGQGVILVFPGPKAAYTGFTAGALFAGNYSTMPYWLTIDLGVAFEI